MVFLIQNSQNRDAAAIQIKLDEILRSIDGAHLALLDLEELEKKDLDRILKDYREPARQCAGIYNKESRTLMFESLPPRDAMN